MEVLPAEGSNSGDGLKDVEKAAMKVNGDMNGSVEGMEVDEDSQDSEGVSEDAPVTADHSDNEEMSDGEAKGDSHLEEADGKSNSHLESEGEGKSNSHVESEGEGKSNSHFGSEYGGKSESNLEGLDAEGDGESINSEEEDHLLNSDNEGEDEQDTKDEHIDDDDETEEEGDINEGPESPSIKDDKSEKDGDGESITPALNGEITPKKKKPVVPASLTLTPRRSSRTVQKPVRFGQEHPDDSDEEEMDANLDSEVEEIQLTDPLADPLAVEKPRFPRMIGNTTIVVSDSKKLADIAFQKSTQQQPKKEPTLVIIDTNTLMAANRGVPMQTAGGVTITQHPAPAKAYPAPLSSYPPKPKPPPILPSLTDDMYVVEAPSFIVPYVYEKPPVKKFKKYLRKMLKQVRKQEEERQALEDKEDEEAERLEKEMMEKEGKTAKKEGEELEEEGVKLKKEDAEEEDEESKEGEKDEKNEEPIEGVKKEEKVAEKMEVDEVKIDEVPLKKEVEDDAESKKESEEKETDSEKIEDGAKDPEVAVQVKEEGKSEDLTKKTKKEADKKDDESSDTDEESDEEDDKKKTPGTGSYFANPLGKFFMQIGMNLVQEFVQTDLLKQQKKKQKAGRGTDETQAAIISLKKNLILSKENNEPYNMEQHKCEFCSFKTESKLIMAHHLETPHMRNYVYRCNFCPLEVRGPHDILLHMEAEHMVRGRLERAPAFHQCPQCPFEDNQKGKLTRHLLTCAKKFRPEKNLEPPLDWEPPAKIPRVPRKSSAIPPNVNSPLYQQALAAKNMPHALMPKMGPGMSQSTLLRPRGRPSFSPQTPSPSQKMNRAPLPPQLTRANMMYRSPGSNPVLLPSPYPMAGSHLFQVMGPQGQMMSVPAGPPALQRLGAPSPSQQQKNPATVKLLNQPSISITPLPRQPSNPQPGVPPQRQGAPSASKTTFVICEICDGYIKDLEQLRNHMQWIHKVKIHPKMIYNRPPLNCQKCQFRFFTDQGLERHLLGSHGLVTSSMQDSANKGKDGGRCPVCGRVYQWKLLNHVARDHNMTLKPAHLSYKCTVCTATFGMYKQFESHVYSAHSVVAKRVMDKKNGQAPASSRPDTASLLKPLKINDEITIIPQPAKKPQQPRPVPGNYRVGSQGNAAAAGQKRASDSVQVIDLEDSPNKMGENGGSESLTAVKERLKRRKSLEIRQLESEADGSDSEEPPKHTEEDDDEDDDRESDGDSDG